jgi:hypothetical protein
LFWPRKLIAEEKRLLSPELLLEALRTASSPSTIIIGVSIYAHGKHMWRRTVWRVAAAVVATVVLLTTLLPGCC